MKDHHDILVFPKDVDMNYLQAIIDYASDNDVPQIEAKRIIDGEAENGTV